MTSMVDSTTERMEELARQLEEARQENHQLRQQMPMTGAEIGLPDGEFAVRKTVQGYQELGFKPTKPDIFYGKRNEDLDGWVYQLEQYIDLCNIREDMRVKFATNLLREDAAKWWRNILRIARSDGGVWLQTQQWINFKTELYRQFQPVDAIKIARRRLATLRQITSVVEYEHRFRSLILEINDISNAEALDRFVYGLSPRVRQEVELRDAKNLEEAIHIAQRFDAITWKNDESSRRGWLPRSNTSNWKLPEVPRPNNYGRNVEFPRSNMPNWRTTDTRRSNSFDNRKTQPMEIDNIQHDRRDRFKQERQCFICKGTGHIANNCPKKHTYKQRSVAAIEAEGEDFSDNEDLKEQDQ